MPGRSGGIARSRNFNRIARQATMDREGLDEALSGDGSLNVATVIKVSHALGLRMHFDGIA